MTDIIVYETARHYVVRLGNGKGFEVYRHEAAAAVRCARIGYPGDLGLQRAKLEVERRETLER